ncbi:MAG TPA: hypothetical protein VH854_17720, partial [Thermoanaerobaculia bacterium]|nr:hypothetical protein [Thermoanaerobaculia bacterium]
MSDAKRVSSKSNLRARRAARVCTVLILSGAAALTAATFTVTNTNDTGAGSFRQALTDANTNAGADTIHFNIPGSDPNCDAGGVCTITPASSLPLIGDALTIDGYTQPGAAVNTSAIGTNAVLKIVVSGVSAGFSGIALGANSITIRGLVIGGFLDGISGGFVTDIHIVGNFIGINAGGNAAFPNGRNGIYFAPVDATTIGGTALADRNVVSGNGNIGMAVSLGSLTGSIVIQGNLIGTNAAGNAAIPNGSDGVTTDTNGLGGTFTIGGSAPHAANVVSGNMARGLFVGGFGSGTAFTVQGNLIGTDATGTLPIPNGNIGIRGVVNGAAIGGTGAGEGNVIAFNGGGGVTVDGGSYIGVTVRGNSIHDNGFGQLGPHGVGLDLSTNVGGD